MDNEKSSKFLQWNTNTNNRRAILSKWYRYNVYRKTAETEYELLGTTQNLYYEDITAQTDIPYTYKVAYVMGAEEKINYAKKMIYFW